MSSFTISSNKLKTSEFEIEFEHEIDLVEYVGSKYLVMLKIPKGSKEVDNLLGVDLKGEVIWKVQNAEEAFGILQNTPYIAMRIIDEKYAQVTSFFGLRFTVDIKSGKLIEKESIGW